MEELLGLPIPQPDQVTDSLHAYQRSKRGNALRAMAEGVRWGKRGARVNTISGPVSTPDEVGTVGAFLMGPGGGFITGSDILMEGK